MCGSTPTRVIITFEIRHTGLIMASLNVVVKLLPSSPFSLVSSLAFTASFPPPVFISIFSISWAMLTVSISFCISVSIAVSMFYRLPRDRHSDFQGQYSLYVFPFVCSIWWPTTVTAKPKTSRQKQNTSRQNQKPHGKNKLPHGKTKYFTAKTK